MISATWFSISVQFCHDEFKYEEDDREEEAGDEDDVGQDEEAEAHDLHPTDLAG